DRYGIPVSAPHVYRIRREGGDLIEVPASTLRLGPVNLPVGGGGYFRILPYGYTRWAMERINQVEGRPAVFYFHPWEIDPDQPRQASAPLKSRLRHYTNLAVMETKLRRVLADFRWDRVDRVLDAQLPPERAAA